VEPVHSKLPAAGGRAAPCLQRAAAGAERRPRLRKPGRRRRGTALHGRLPRRLRRGVGGVGGVLRVVRGGAATARVRGVARAQVRGAGVRGHRWGAPVPRVQPGSLRRRCKLCGQLGSLGQLLRFLWRRSEGTGLQRRARSPCGRAVSLCVACSALCSVHAHDNKCDQMRQVWAALRAPWTLAPGTCKRAKRPAPAQ
jgi:hypothetical protein